MILAARRSLTMTRRRWAETERIIVDPLTDALAVRLLRPPRRSQVKVSLVLAIDGIEYVCSGRISGNRAAPYLLRYKPGILVRDGRILRRGQTARHSLEAWLRFEVLRGDATLDLLESWVTALLTPNLIVHNSVAFDADTAAEEVGGDGVLSLSHTASGSDRAAFAGSGWSAVSDVASALTSCTYGAGNGMSEDWDINYSGQAFGCAGSHIVNPSTDATTVEATLADTTPNHQVLGVISMTGVDQTTPVGTAATQTQEASATASVTVGSVGADDLVVDTFSCNLTNEPAEGANQTDPATAGFIHNNVNFWVAGSTNSTDGVMEWTVSFANPTALGAVAFKPAGGGGGATDAQKMVAANQLVQSGGMVGREYV